MNKLERIWRLFSGPEKKKFRHFIKLIYPKLLPCLGDNFIQEKSGRMAQEKKGYRTQLLKLMVDFLALQEARNELGYDRYFLQAMNKRGENHLFIPYAQQAKRNIEGHSKGLDAKYYLSKYFTELEVCKFLGRQGERGTLKFEDVLFHLDIFYCLEKLRYTLAIVNQAQSFGGEPNVLLIDPVINLIRKKNYFGVGLLEIYDCIYKMTCSEPDENLHYENLILLLSEYGHQIEQTLLAELYIYAINYSIKRVAHGVTEDLRQRNLKECFDLYRRVIDNDFILENGKLSAFHLKNAILLAVKFDDFKWVEDVIQRFSNHLADDYQDNVLNYTRGVICFYHDDWEQAAKYFRTVLNDFIDIFYGFNSRIYLMKIYYLQAFFENDPIGEEILKAESSSFRVYVNRKRNRGKITDLHRNNYISFVKLITRLTRISLKTEKGERIKKWSRIMDEIRSDASMLGQQWFLKVLSRHLENEK